LVVAILFDAADELVEADFGRVVVHGRNDIRDAASRPDEFVVKTR
jgi:hypothetical protein